MSVRSLWKSQPLVRLFAVHAAVGFGLAAVAVGAILWADPGGLGQLLFHEPVFIAVLWFFVGLTFGSAQMGMAIMGLAEEDEPGGGKPSRAASVIASNSKGPQQMVRHRSRSTEPHFSTNLRRTTPGA